jgi:hypothetical protein
MTDAAWEMLERIRVVLLCMKSLRGPDSKTKPQTELRRSSQDKIKKKHCTAPPKLREVQGIS